MDQEKLTQEPPSNHVTKTIILVILVILIVGAVIVSIVELSNLPMNTAAPEAPGNTQPFISLSELTEGKSDQVCQAERLMLAKWQSYDYHKIPTPASHPYPKDHTGMPVMYLDVSIDFHDENGNVLFTITPYEDARNDIYTIDGEFYRITGSPSDLTPETAVELMEKRYGRSFTTNGVPRVQLSYVSVPVKSNEGIACNIWSDIDASSGDVTLFDNYYWTFRGVEPVQEVSNCVLHVVETRCPNKLGCKFNDETGIEGGVPQSVPIDANITSDEYNWGKDGEYRSGYRMVLNLYGENVPNETEAQLLAEEIKNTIVAQYPPFKNSVSVTLRCYPECPADADIDEYLKSHVVDLKQWTGYATTTEVTQ